MSHRVRLGVVVIDCRTDDLGPAVAYWTKALAMEAEIDADARYAVFDGHEGRPRVLLQAVDHAPRVHLDIETDDIEAEVVRQTGLGAREVARIKTWVVMEAPTGHRFCLVGPQGDDFPGDARQVG